MTLKRQQEPSSRSLHALRGHPTEVNETPTEFCYDLPPPEESLDVIEECETKEKADLLTEITDDARWFCRLRWIVAGVFAGLAVIAVMLPSAWTTSFSIVPQWPLAVAIVLVCGNIFFVLLLRRGAGTHPGCAERTLWAQIILDLVVLTAVVHYSGSLETYVSFAYLFHIVLACIMLPRVQSFVVTALASMLFSGLVLAEIMGYLPTSGLLALTGVREHMTARPGIVGLSVVSALGVWFVVWYLTSTLSEAVRERDVRLARVNRELQMTQAEKVKQLVRMTHELKSPFSAIHANAHALMGGYCGAIPDEQKKHLSRIIERCFDLTNTINDMMNLANIRSLPKGNADAHRIDLKEILALCLEQITPMAEERHIRLLATPASAYTSGNEEHLRTLLINLLSNAVTYSHDGGQVDIRCGMDEEGPSVDIVDHGIGIVKEKMPKIFDEFYRTDEAVKHNKRSTGLGLAIVRDIAHLYGVKVRVCSEPLCGTSFLLRFRKA